MRDGKIIALFLIPLDNPSAEKNNSRFNIVNCLIQAYKNLHLKLNGEGNA